MKTLLLSLAFLGIAYGMVSADPVVAQCSANPVVAVITVTPCNPPVAVITVTPYRGTVYNFVPKNRRK